MAETYGEDADVKQKFEKHLSSLVNGGVASICLALGHRLDLFSAITSTSLEDNPKTSQQIAETANLRERYVREWLGVMVCNDIVNVDETGTKYWIDVSKRASLWKEMPSPNLVLAEMCVQGFAQTATLVENCFKKDGPRGTSYSDYDQFHSAMAQLTQRQHSLTLLPKILPMGGPELISRLKAGCRVLDVGCGNGYQLRLMAEHFPKSSFVGVDIDHGAVDTANKTTSELENVSFECHDAQKLPDAWTDRFDLITIFDACHDQARPDLCLKQVYRCLAPTGIFFMMEIQGTSNQYLDHEQNKDAGFLYGVSLLHCMPIALKDEDGLGLGAMWGAKLATQMLKDSGFKSVIMKDIPATHNTLYLCKKK